MIIISIVWFIVTTPISSYTAIFNVIIHILWKRGMPRLLRLFGLSSSSDSDDDSRMSSTSIIVISDMVRGRT